MKDDDYRKGVAQVQAARLSKTVPSGAVMHFREVRIKEQLINAGADSMLVGDVVFDLFVRGETVALDVVAGIRGSGGADLVELFEIAWPVGYTGPRLSYESYRGNIERYYRALIGTEGKILGLDHVTNMKLVSVAVRLDQDAEVVLAGEGVSGW